MSLNTWELAAIISSPTLGVFPRERFGLLTLGLMPGTSNGTPLNSRKAHLKPRLRYLDVKSIAILARLDKHERFNLRS